MGERPGMRRAVLASVNASSDVAAAACLACGAEQQALEVARLAGPGSALDLST